MRDDRKIYINCKYWIPLYTAKKEVETRCMYNHIFSISEEKKITKARDTCENFLRGEE